MMACENKKYLFRGSLCVVVVVVLRRRRSFSSEKTDFMILPGFPISSTSCERNASDKNADKPPQRKKKKKKKKPNVFV